MATLRDEMLTSYYLYESDADLEIVRGDDGGVSLRRAPDPAAEAAALGPGAYRDPYALSEAAGAPITEEEVAGTMAGIVPGGAIGMATGIQDIGALGYGGYKAATAEEGQRINEFLKGFSAISGVIGSERAFELYDAGVDMLPVSDEAKQGLKQGAMVGEVLGLGKAGEAVVGGAKAYAAGAPARMAERQGGVMLGMGVDPMPIIDEAIVAISKKTPPVGEDDLINVLKIKAQQMELPPEKRIQPSGQNPLFDTTPQGYERNIPEQLETPVPRAPEGKKLPKNNRAAILIEKADQITDQMADNIRPHLDNPVRYFYHTGPLIDKAVELGVPENVARQQLKKFALNYAATSPRTPTEANLRSASVVSAKETRGIDYRDIVGPGTGGISEAGYPMMVGPGGIHAKLIDAVRAEGIDYDTNPKPATFAENVVGNLQGVTADTHAIRGALDALNKAEPGSIPKEWFGENVAQQNKLYAEYLKNPQALRPEKDVLPASLASQKIDGTSKQTEYAIISDLYKMTAEKLGITPAEAQALHWFTQGERTGLVSDPKTIVDIIEERIDVTAQATGKSKENVFLDFFSGKMPLMSLAGGAAGLTLLEAGSTMYGKDEVM